MNFTDAVRELAEGRCKTLDINCNYILSKDGDCYRIDFTKCHINKLKPQKMNGYLKIRIAVSGKYKNLSIHRLVLTTFGNTQPSDKHEVAHKDGNRFNNHINNLMWATRAENNDHKFLHGTVPLGSDHHNSKLKESEVIKIKERIASRESLKSIHLDYNNVGYSVIKQIKYGKIWKHI